MTRITVLRLGHRIGRDKRLTTHVALAARAFGADAIIITGDRDDKVLASIRRVAELWGGDFQAEHREDWRQVIRDFKARGSVVIHLTMYGLPLKDVIDELRRLKDEKDLLVVVGGPKVEKEVFYMSDYNVAVTNQPHSEVSALAVFLDWLHEGKEQEKEFKNAKLKVVPQKLGKR